MKKLYFLISLILIIVFIAGCAQQLTKQQITEGEIVQQPSINLPWQIVCGNNKCESGETKENCCRDCGCDSGLYCESNICKSKCENF
ncbi:MAG: hypothetical protein QXD55_01885 [Candidatus Aenigmatarchaeota archaeon]